MIIIRNVIIGLVLTVTIFIYPAAAAESLRFGMAPSAEALTAVAAKSLGEMIQARSNGRIKFEFFPGAQLGKSNELVEMVKTGALQGVITSTQYYSKMIPYVGALDLPFLFKDALDAWVAYHGPAFEMISKDLEKHGFKVIGWTNYGPRDMICSARSITKAEDLVGLKWRVPPSPIYTKFWEAWGAKPTPMPMGELFTALEAGAVDGVSFDADTIYKQKFYEVAKHFTLTGHIFTFSPYTVNKAWYDSLPKDLQEMIVESTEIVGDWESMKIYRGRLAAAQKMADEGTTVNSMPAEEIAKLRAKLKPVYDFARSEYSPEFVNLVLGK